MQVTKLGKVHIPKKLRERIGWAHEDTINIFYNREEDTLILKKVVV